MDNRDQLIRLSLEAEFANRYLPLLPYTGKNFDEPKNIFILDSIIIRNNLPELPEGKFILINSKAIIDSARLVGKFDYIKLFRLTQYPDSATIVWESASEILSRKFNRFIYNIYRDDKYKYHLTSTGWIGGLTSSIHYLGLKVQ
jgi:hypothetical protein